MIAATDRPWNSATTLYIARKIQAFAAERSAPLKVLNMGCGGAITTQALHPDGYDQYGYDIALNKSVVYPVVSKLYPDDYQERFIQSVDERTIPFADNTFDVIFANQVFEHVRFMDRMFEECARVLRPEGMLIALFPFASVPIEFHLKIPFAHWIPPGQARVNYLRPFYALGLRPKEAGKNSYESAVYWEQYMRDFTYYRLKNEVVMLMEYYFERWEDDTAAYIEARRDLCDVNPTLKLKLLKAFLEHFPHKPLLYYLVGNYFGATLAMRCPRKK
ncbi:MAG: class I SAM-dependent methyltransferase [Chloroflexi bacterium]|nr:class I SAM-dependent methyltransferase [Chloroflexota bacterium]